MGGPKIFDAGKKIKKKKRAILVDVLGNAFLVLIVAASVQGCDAGARLVEMAAIRFPSLQKIWVDSAHRGEVIENVKKKTGIDAEVALRSDTLKGFMPVRKPWVVERTFGWLNRSRRLARDYENTLDFSQAWLDIASTRLGLGALTRAPLRFRTVPS